MAPDPQHREDRYFCSKPFEWLEIHGGRAPKGNSFVCCPAWLPKPVGNLVERSIEDLWNGPEARAIRQSILDGTFAYCSAVTCPFLQTKTGPVRRASDVVDPDMRRVLDEQLVELPWRPRVVNCSYDRSCNLSCPSCRTDLIVETQREDEILAVQRKLEGGALRSARAIMITGSGDPFGSPYFKRWLFSMRLEDMPELENIHLHTNAQAWTASNWHRIPADVRAHIHTAEISIDAATPATYAANRRGGDFAQLLDNLEFIAGLRRDGPLRWIKIHMCVQRNNFSEMPAFLALGKRFGVDSVYYSLLQDWGTFAPADYRARAIHLSTHPEHEALLEQLRDPSLDDPLVDLGNLTALLHAAAGAR